MPRQRSRQRVKAVSSSAERARLARDAARQAKRQAKLAAERAGRRYLAGLDAPLDPALAQASAAASAARVNTQQDRALSAHAHTPPPAPTPGGGSPRPGGEGSSRGPPDKSVGAPPITAGEWQTGAELAARDVRPPERAIERRAREQREAARELIRMCRDKTQDAVDTLATIMRDPAQKGVARVAAAKTLIEFGHGRAPSTLNIQRSFSPEELELLAKALVQKRLNEARVVDAKESL